MLKYLGMKNLDFYNFFQMTVKKCVRLCVSHINSCIEVEDIKHVKVFIKFP